MRFVSSLEPLLACDNLREGPKPGCHEINGTYVWDLGARQYSMYAEFRASPWSRTEPAFGWPNGNDKPRPILYRNYAFAPVASRSRENYLPVLPPLDDVILEGEEWDVGISML